jgi:hypothetical protein
MSRGITELGRTPNILSAYIFIEVFKVAKFQAIHDGHDVMQNTFYKYSLLISQETKLP